MYSFKLRNHAGEVHSQMVTAYVFYNYRVGDYFNDLQPLPVQPGKRCARSTEPRFQEPPVPTGPEPMRTRRPTGRFIIRSGQRAFITLISAQRKSEPPLGNIIGTLQSWLRHLARAPLTHRLTWFRQPLSEIAMVRDKGELDPYRVKVVLYH